MIRLQIIIDICLYLPIAVPGGAVAEPPGGVRGPALRRGVAAVPAAGPDTRPGTLLLPLESGYV